ncbi:MAG TPA: hypothetical protein VG228_05750 [Solirubrobacteraceae bacterium]|jgi:hypothetical protein|nr:hypothetical protein [Solirubrobacteraceae bacterium]
MVKPAMPTTTASSIAPNRSSCPRTPAMPPLRPNTNTPLKLSTRISVALMPGTTEPVS